MSVLEGFCLPITWLGCRGSVVPVVAIAWLGSRSFEAVVGGVYLLHLLVLCPVLACPFFLVRLGRYVAGFGARDCPSDVGLPFAESNAAKHFLNCIFI